MHWILVILVVLVSGCQTPREGTPSPMATLCMTTDFSNHTHEQLQQCKAWLAANAQGYTETAPKTQWYYVYPPGEMVRVTPVR